MDKQKQIEEKRKHFVEVNEMAKEIDKYYPNAKITNSHLVEYLYNAGYRKIPENAVVLTETEYNDLLSDEVKTIERDIAEYWATEEVATVAKELHKEGYRKIDDHAILVLRKAKCLEQKIRKETAEKFAERLKDALFDLGNVVTEKDIDEIAEEITEGK